MRSFEHFLCALLISFIPFSSFTQDDKTLREEDPANIEYYYSELDRLTDSLDNWNKVLDTLVAHRVKTRKMVDSVLMDLKRTVDEALSGFTKPIFHPGDTSEFPLKSKVAYGAECKIDDYFFAHGSCKLLEDSLHILDQLALTLSSDHIGHFEVRYFCVDAKDRAKNMRRGKRRARVIEKYLIRKGINKYSYSGYHYYGEGTENQLLIKAYP